jgi:hypothetical protein
MLRINKVDGKHSIICDDKDLQAQVDAVNPIRDMLKDRSKCLLYTKNENVYIRFISGFILKNGGLDRYDTIHIISFDDKDNIMVTLLINNEIEQRFIFKGQYA